LNTSSMPVNVRRLRALATVLGVCGGAANVGLALWIWVGVLPSTGDPVWDQTHAVRYAVALTVLSSLGLASALFLTKVPKLAGLLLVILAGVAASLSLVLATVGLTAYAGFLPAVLLVPASILQVAAGGLALSSVR
jgi:hypothetical protein